MHGAAMISRDEIDAVLFDIGGVFTIRRPASVRAGMARGGFVLPEHDARYHEAHYAAVRALSDLLDGEPVNEYEPGFWENFERGYLRHLGVPADRIDDAVQVLRDEVLAKEAKPLWTHMLTENIDGFHRIAASGLPVGIVSNNDGTAAEQMADFGICQIGPGPATSVACIVDSGELGIAKPDPAIFLPALGALGTDPARTLYVGDTVHADVHGAQAAGMLVVQLDPYDYHAHLPHLRLPHVTALADLLGA